MLVQLLIDNINSWVLPYGKELQIQIKNKGAECLLIHKHEEIQKGDILVLLSCEQILKKLDLNKYNLVIHASKLPEGKGWSPLTWQILEGKNEIPLTLFEVNEKVDAGEIYFQEDVRFEGHELLNELREKIGRKSNELILKFIDLYPGIKSYPQLGKESFYKKRKLEDAELNVNKNIEEQFNLFRIADNERYPVYFKLKGHKYILKIHKQDE